MEHTVLVLNKKKNITNSYKGGGYGKDNDEKERIKSF